MTIAPLRVVRRKAEHDLAAAERAAADLLNALGIDLDTDSLRETPGRMARAYAELLTPRPFRPTTFPNDEGYDELVLARDIPIRSVCEHHMLPFVGVAHVGYLPGERMSGCPSSRGSSSTSPTASRFRSGSPNRSPTGSPSAFAEGRRRRDRSRTPVHDPARRAGHRLHDGHVHSRWPPFAKTLAREEFLALTAHTTDERMEIHMTFVIVGAGLAGAKAAETLREQGYEGRIVLIGTRRSAPTSALPYPRA